MFVSFGFSHKAQINTTGAITEMLCVILRIFGDCVKNL